MQFDKLVEQILEQNLGSRVSIGSDEVRDILKTGQVTSKGPYSGHTYFSTNPNYPSQRAIGGLNTLYGASVEDLLNPGRKIGYVMKANTANLQTPSEGLPRNPDGTYKVLPPNAPAKDIQTLQRIRAPKNPQGVAPDDLYSLGKERDFGRFMEIYKKLQKAFEAGKIRIQPPRISPTMGSAGVAALMQFLNTEVPPDMKNSMLAGGGYGIKGKFEAIP